MQLINISYKPGTGSKRQKRIETYCSYKGICPYAQKGLCVEQGYQEGCVYGETKEIVGKTTRARSYTPFQFEVHKHVLYNKLKKTSGVYDIYGVGDYIRIPNKTLIDLISKNNNLAFDLGWESKNRYFLKKDNVTVDTLKRLIILAKDADQGTRGRYYEYQYTIAVLELVRKIDEHDSAFIHTCTENEKVISDLYDNLKQRPIKHENYKKIVRKHNTTCNFIDPAGNQCVQNYSSITVSLQKSCLAEHVHYLNNENNKFEFRCDIDPETIVQLDNSDLSKYYRAHIAIRNQGLYEDSE